MGDTDKIDGDWANYTMESMLSEIERLKAAYDRCDLDLVEARTERDELLGQVTDLNLREQDLQEQRNELLDRNRRQSEMVIRLTAEVEALRRMEQHMRWLRDVGAMTREEEPFFTELDALRAEEPKACPETWSLNGKPYSCVLPENHEGAHVHREDKP